MFQARTMMSLPQIKNFARLACFALAIASNAVDTLGAENISAQEIFEATGVKGGLIVHLGCGDGELTAALHASDSYLVHGLDVDRVNVDQARKSIRSIGKYGPVSIDTFDGKHLPYADNLVNLLVSQDTGAVSSGEVMRVLAPNGMAYIKESGKWTKKIKKWPKEIDEWTHWLHGADGNPVARDTVVRPPRQVQWFAKPAWSRSHEKSPSLTGMVSAKGRLFYISDEGPASIGGPLPDKWRLVARDAFSGVPLWKIPVPDWGWQAWSPGQPMNLRWGNPRFIHRRLVAAEDRVYVTLGYSAPVSALDAATGKVIRVYQGSENTCEILFHESLVILSVATISKTAIEKSPSLKVMAFEAASGNRLWEAGPFPSLHDLGERGKSNVLKQGRLMIVAGGGHVYCVTDKEILALSQSNGERAWSIPRLPTELVNSDSKKNLSKSFGNLGSIMYHDGRVFYAQPHVPSGKKLSNSSRMSLVCLEAKTGKEQWRKICADWSYTTSLNVYAARGLIWVHEDPKEEQYDFLGLNPQTGEVKVEYNLESILATKHHHRCYRNKATENFLLMGKEGVEYVNLENGAINPHRWLRGMCLYGIMPANGLLYVPPQACSCNPMTMLSGYWALAGKSSEGGRGKGEGGRSESRDVDRLERGPAYQQIPLSSLQSPASSLQPSSDWPMYRHDPLRSAATHSAVPAWLGERWKTTIGGKLTGPVIASGRVYLGCRDTHQLVALDATLGTEIWRYSTGAGMDSPPTVYQGMVLVGCSDGWVYCLRAADGSLIWRFRAAPSVRTVVAENQVESAWPVHGSIMILGDIAYVTAGRSSFLDGGIHFYMLEPRTGELLDSGTLFTEQNDQKAYYEGVTSDLLVSDSKDLFLRHLHLDPKTLELTRIGSWGYKGPERSAKEQRRGGKNSAIRNPQSAFRGLPVSEQRFEYLRSGQGFLDDSLYARTRFHLDGGESCHLLCFDQHRAFGFQLSTHSGHFVFFTPGKEGYSILGFERGRTPKKKNKPIWQQKLPLRVYAMVLAGENLFVSGVPDRIDPDDPLASFEGRMGGELFSLSCLDGKMLTKIPLDAPPVFDGMAAAGGRLFVSTADGSVLCLDKAN